MSHMSSMSFYFPCGFLWKLLQIFEEIIVLIIHLLHHAFIICQIFRVYYDRLVDDDDRSWLAEFMQGVVKTHLKEDFHQLFAHLDFNQDGKVEEDDLRSLMFCDFTDAKNENKNYIEVMDVEKLRVIVEGHLDEFNAISRKPMNLVMFRYVLGYILYLCTDSLSFSQGMDLSCFANHVLPLV